MGTKCRTGFYQLVVDWMEADRLNVSLQSIGSKGAGFKFNDN